MGTICCNVFLFLKATLREVVKKCRFHFLRALYAARFSLMQQTPETIFRIHKASCNLVMSEDNPYYILFAIHSEPSRNQLWNQTPLAKPDLLFVFK